MGGDLNADLPGVSGPGIGVIPGPGLEILEEVAPVLEGTTYPFILETVPSDFSDIERNYLGHVGFGYQPTYAGYKIFKVLHLDVEPTGPAFPLSVEILIDGKSKGIVTFQIPQGGGVLPFDLPVVLGESRLRRLSRGIGGEGYYFALKIVETGPNNPRLARAFVEFDVKGPGR
jgi:hypothetical protein